MRHSFASLAVALLMLSAGAVTGCKKDGQAVATEGTVAVKADGDGFHPSSVTFKKGATAALVFTRTTEETCATEVVFPALNIKKDLPMGVPVKIDVPTDKEQTLAFQCGMGMYKSSVVVAEQK